MCSLNFSRLCRLINDHLRPYTIKEPFLLTKEIEKHLLIYLSQVSREAKELFRDSQHEAEVNLAFDDKWLQGLESLPREDHNCLVNIISVLVIFLTVESLFVQHAAGNALVVVSNILIKSEREWKLFLHLLGISLKLAISNIHSSSLLLLPAGSVIPVDERLTKNDSQITDETSATAASDQDAASFVSFFRIRLANANWCTVTGLIRVLRNILKSLKEIHGELVEVYMHSVSYSLSNVPWDLLNEIHVVSPESKGVFIGSLLQLLCSLVDKNGLEELSESSLDKIILAKVTDLVPKLLCWCFSILETHQDYNHMSVSRYLRHKMLMLMIRLSFHIHQQSSTLLLWLQLLRKYFNDLLYKPISERHVGTDNCLEGSPFLVCITDGVKGQNLCTRHLQRQAVFLLFKCSFSLIRLSEETSTKCARAPLDSCLITDLQTSREHGCRNCLSELSEWLQRHISPNKFSDHETFLDKCSSFSVSFLQLYMDEDDFLFEMLLQLLSSPFPALLVQNKERGKSFEEVKEDILFQISSIFNPIRLFHLFLIELHYDHLVILDYLISKDTGIRCVQYLLRCLRIVCKSWRIFVEFSVQGSEISQSSCKKRKVYLDVKDSHGKTDLQSEGSEKSWLLEKQNNRKHKSGRTCKTSRQWAFENAKECLLSLKESVENLHRKNLFPYNPTVLLRSFTQFEMLCQQQEQEHLQKTFVTT